MNYKTTIAFLGKRKLQDYKSTPELIHINNGEEWTDEFMLLMGIKDKKQTIKHTSQDTAHNAYSGKISFFMGTGYTVWSPGESEYEMYYRPSDNFLFLDTLTRSGKPVQKQMNFINNHTKEELRQMHEKNLTEEQWDQ